MRGHIQNTDDLNAALGRLCEHHYLRRTPARAEIYEVSPLALARVSL